MCGVKVTDGTFCPKCLRELHPLLSKVKDAHIDFCVLSGDVRLQTAWERMSVEEAIEKAVKKALVPGAEVTILNVEVGQAQSTVTGGEQSQEVIFDFLKKPGIDRVVDVPVTVTGSVEGAGEYSEEYLIPLHIKTTVSKKYSKIGSQYFEGTLQLRNEEPRHVVALKKHFSRFPDLAINKTIDVSTGHDYQITDKQRMRQIALKLQQQFGGLMKENARLVTRDKQKSKDVYRLTILLEFPPYHVGDVLTDGKRVLELRSFGKKLQFRNVLTGKKVELLYEKDLLEPVEVFDAKISQAHPELAILHPETFQQVPVRAREELAVDSEVRVVQHKNAWYVI